MSHTLMFRSLGRTAVVAVVAVGLLTGCLGAGSCSASGSIGERTLGTALAWNFGMAAASASCAAGVEYEGHFYAAWSAKLPVAKGDLLGDAVYPPCDDGGGCEEGAVDTTGRPTKVWAMRGVDPDQVVVGRMEGTNRLVVFGRLRADPEEFFRFTGEEWRIRVRAQDGQ